ncbi:hypothetical protein LA080_004362 [Diaporthe eres]|nr:hypothetical protein LA080_004362 [Diaporthe eres]
MGAMECSNIDLSLRAGPMVTNLQDFSAWNNMYDVAISDHRLGRLHMSTLRAPTTEVSKPRESDFPTPCIMSPRCGPGIGQSGPRARPSVQAAVDAATAGATSRRPANFALFGAPVTKKSLRRRGIRTRWVVVFVAVAPCQWLSLLLLHGGLPVHFIPHGGVAWLKHRDVSTELVILNQKPTPRRPCFIRILVVTSEPIPTCGLHVSDVTSSCGIGLDKLSDSTPRARHVLVFCRFEDRDHGLKILPPLTVNTRERAGAAFYLVNLLGTPGAANLETLFPCSTGRRLLLRSPFPVNAASTRAAADPHSPQGNGMREPREADRDRRRPPRVITASVLGYMFTALSEIRYDALPYTTRMGIRE